MSNTSNNERQKTDINSDLFDDHSDRYTDEINQAIGFSGLDVDFFTKAKAEHLVEFAKRHFGGLGDLKVLDLGCGIGTYETILSGNFERMTGIDVSEKSVQAAKKSNPSAEYHVYDGQRLPFDNDSFDLVFAICVMHHVPVGNWPTFASEAMRVIKPGGVFAIYEHNPLNPLTRRVVSNCEFDADAVLLRPRDILTALGTRATRTEHEYILAVPPMNRFLSAVDQKLSRIALGAQYAFRAYK